MHDIVEESPCSHDAEMLVVFVLDETISLGSCKVDGGKGPKVFCTMDTP